MENALLRIAFGCESRIGKDTACEYLQEKFGGVILHFSDPLYEILYSAQNIIGFKQEKDPYFLQWVGTEWIRKKDVNRFTNILEEKLNFYSKENIFVGDVRFPNEFEMLKRNGFICCRIIRTNKLIDRNTNHSSEISLLNCDWDFVIYNDTSIQEFQEKIKEIALKFI